MANLLGLTGQPLINRLLSTKFTNVFCALCCIASHQRTLDYNTAATLKGAWQTEQRIAHFQGQFVGERGKGSGQGSGCGG